MRLLLTALLLFSLAIHPLRAADWPQFRGPNGDGIAPGKVRQDWAKKPPRLRWQVAMTDDGFAGPAVAGGIVYIVL